MTGHTVRLKIELEGLSYDVDSEAEAVADYADGTKTLVAFKVASDDVEAMEIIKSEGMNPDRAWFVARVV